MASTSGSIEQIELGPAMVPHYFASDTEDIVNPELLGLLFDETVYLTAGAPIDPNRVQPVPPVVLRLADDDSMDDLGSRLSPSQSDTQVQPHESARQIARNEWIHNEALLASHHGRVHQEQFASLRLRHEERSAEMYQEENAMMTRAIQVQRGVLQQAEAHNESLHNEEDALHDIEDLRTRTREVLSEVRETLQEVRHAHHEAQVYELGAAYYQLAWAARTDQTTGNPDREIRMAAAQKARAQAAAKFPGVTTATHIPPKSPPDLSSPPSRVIPHINTDGITFEAFPKNAVPKGKGRQRQDNPQQGRYHIFAELPPRLSHVVDNASLAGGQSSHQVYAKADGPLPQ